MSIFPAAVSHLVGAVVPWVVPLEVCPKAPPGAQKYADDVMGYVLWGVGIVFFLGLVIFAVIYAFRPGSKKVQNEAANSIFRNEKQPAGSDEDLQPVKEA